MAGSSFGTIFRITTWGESHGKAVGAVVDGCPAGLALCEADIQKYLDQRKPGQSAFSTPRKEEDLVEILSGVFEGKTTGTPISLLIRNSSARSSDYSQIAGVYRPGHADYTFDQKYGIRDYRGGGRSSGRETAARVAGGAIALRLLEELGIRITAWVSSIGPVTADPAHFDPNQILRNPLFMPDSQAAEQAAAFVQECKESGDSAGGVIECEITGLPAGIGDPVFEKISANLARAVCSIGAVKGFEIGDGFAAAHSKGSENNDPFRIGSDGKPVKSSNHAGGVLGGMTDGSPLLFRCAVKPTPSISRPQSTVTSSGEETEISIHGRHDPVIAPRAVIVVKSMAAIAIADAMLMGMGARLDTVKTFYHE